MPKPSRRCAGTAALVILLAATGLPAAGQDVDRVASHGDWSVFADGQGAERLCWVATVADQRSLVPVAPGGQQPSQKIPVLFTTGSDELSLEVGASSGSGHIAIGGERFPLLMQDGWAWLAKVEDGPALKALMADRETAYLEIGGAGYEFSLDGFDPEGDGPMPRWCPGDSHDLARLQPGAGNRGEQVKDSSIELLVLTNERARAIRRGTPVLFRWRRQGPPARPWPAAR